MANDKPLINLMGALKAGQRVTTTLLPISLIIFAYQRTLVPLYASYPTAYLLNTIILASSLISVLQPVKAKSRTLWLIAGLDLMLAPNATYWVAVWTSRQKWPILGPAITHTLVLAPLVFVFATLLNESNSNSESPIHRLTRAGGGFFIATTLAHKYWPRLSYLNKVSDSQIFLVLAVLAISQFILRIKFSPGTHSASNKGKKVKEPAPRYPLSDTQIKFTLLAVFTASWWKLHPYFENPILPHPLQETFTHPTGKLQIHSAVQSLTGLIVVGETLPPLNGEEDHMHSARYLRADHSLLGGVWLRDKVQVIDNEKPVMDSFDTPLGDTIYSTFVLQEAARLVNSTKAGKSNKWKNALTIGLGTGLSATSFIRHGLNTSIVEIDPAVYDAARTWFGLPDPGPDNVFLQDARAWLNDELLKTGNVEKKLYDIVVHDCFSGGGVPEHIFTTEFWAGLKQVMQPDGVLAVNFAGEVASESSKYILHTLESNFKSCRAFHDLMESLGEDRYGTEFINIVFFCTNSPAPLTFRKGRRSDYLGSPLCRYIFDGLADREINLNAIREQDPVKVSSYVLTDEKNLLGELQRKQGIHHWELMRMVLPDLHWETF